MTQYQQVKEFMTLFKQECPNKPTIPSLDIRRTRAAKLIFSEALELIKGLGFTVYIGHIKLTDSNTEFFEKEPNLLEVLDGLCDLHYVGFLGTAIACGIPESNLNKAFDEVHRSNMSKMWKESELEEAKQKYPTGVVEDYGGGLYRLIVDGKIIKSPSYSPAQLEQFLIIKEPTEQPQYKKQTCRICGCIGHNESQCVLYPACSACGETDHPDRQCVDGN